MKRRHFFSLLTALFSLCTLSACSDDDDVSETPSAFSLPVVSVLYTPNGLGDGGYNDSISRGVYEAQLIGGDAAGTTKERFLINSFSPETYAEGEAFFTDWLQSYGKHGVRELLVVASSDYEALVRKYRDSIPDTNDAAVILLESRATDLPAHTLHVPLYGASYEAGLLAKQCVFTRKALVMKANNFDEAIQDGAQGFADGYLAATDTLPDFYTLTEDSTGGYDNADVAYLLGSYIGKNYDFVYPLIGGSIQGLLQYDREVATNNLFFLAGIDANMSALSNFIPFSVVKHMSRIVSGQITSWLNGATLPRHQSFGYADGGIEVIQHWEDDEYYHYITDAQRQEIIRKEAEYESSK